MKKIVLSPNPYRDRSLALTMRAKAFLEADGRETVISPVFVDVPGDSNMIPLRRAAEDAELIISFGGDGTFLHVARQVMDLEIPMLGVNMGTKGFMAALEPEDIGLVRRAAAGDFRPSRRMLLDVELRRADGDSVLDCALNEEWKAEAARRGLDCALNDVVVKSDVSCIGLTITADGTRVTEFSGDGVIISTPTGSTAYSMSAGGPIVEPEAENIVITPICAHIMAAKSFVLSPARRVVVQTNRLRSRVALLSVDGTKAIAMEDRDEVLIRRSPKTVIMADMGVTTFYESAMNKLTGI